MQAKLSQRKRRTRAKRQLKPQKEKQAIPVTLEEYMTVGLFRMVEGEDKEEEVRYSCQIIRVDIDF